MRSDRRSPSFELLAEMQRVYPPLASSLTGGISLGVSPEEALRRLRELPDNAGLEALLRALGLETDGPSGSGGSAPPAV